MIHDGHVKKKREERKTQYFPLKRLGAVSFLRYASTCRESVRRKFAKCHDRRYLRYKRDRITVRK